MYDFIIFVPAALGLYWFSRACRAPLHNDDTEELVDTREEINVLRIPFSRLKKYCETPHTTVYSKETHYNCYCPICLEDYDSNEKVHLLKCNHVYHDKCILRWLYMNSSCPLCRVKPF